MTNTNDIDASSTRTVAAAPGGGWQVAWGVLLIIAGILAVLMPGIAALATALFLAWLLIFGGGLGGLLGVIFAVPTVAVLKVLFDFFYDRLTTAGQMTT